MTEGLHGTEAAHNDYARLLASMAGFVRVLAFMCGDRACASDATGTSAVRHGQDRMPSSAWVPSRIRGACRGPDAMRERCSGALAATVREAGRSRALRRIRCTVAIDDHLMPRHDMDPAAREEQLVRAGNGNGTSRFEAYATAKMEALPGHGGLDMAPREHARGHRVRRGRAALLPGRRQLPDPAGGLP